MLQDNQNQALKFAIKLISFRRRSVFEITKRLEQKGFTENIIKQVLDELNQCKYLDDEKFAESWINDRINFSPRGRALIKKELIEKGVAENIVDEKIGELLGEEKELELSKKLVEKKLKTLDKDIGKNKTLQKIGSYLQSKGYSSCIICEVLKNMLPCED